MRVPILALVLGACGASGAADVADVPPPTGTSGSEPGAARDGRVASEPPSERFELGPGDACLPSRLDAILLRTSSDRSVVDPGYAEYAIGGSTVVLVPPAGRLRRIVDAAGALVSVDAMDALGVEGSIVAAQLVLGGDRGCFDVVGAPGPVGIPGVERATPLTELAELADAVFATGSTERAEMVAAARAALDLLAPASAAPGALPRSERQLVAWSARPTATGGEMLLLLRVQRDYVHEEDSHLPHAGSVWCHAPPGADCAPRCVPPREQITETFVGEAAIRVTFDATGAVTATVSEPAGVLSPPIVRSTGVGDCRR